jgi:hypothetical protein
VLPWQQRGHAPRAEQDDQPSAAEIYLGYLAERPDSAVAALRLIASSGGATIVHCAAGKDRTGVITALTLAELGVDRELIIDDYALSAERIESIFARLRASPTYAGALVGASIDRHRPRPETMRDLLDGLDDLHGGARRWLRAHGWSETDAAALRAHLLV